MHIICYHMVNILKNALKALNILIVLENIMINKEYVSNEKRDSSKSTLAFVLIALLFSLYISISGVTLPHPKSDDTPLTEFSALKAYNHLKVIAKNVHFTGTAENEKVRNYIIQTLNDIGLESTIQKKSFLGVKHWGYVNVHNIICRIQGTKNNNSTILLVAHYDTMPTAPGAMDDGSGVVTLLETARALKAGEPLKNDIILLFTDGEEPGLLGAEAFVEDNQSLMSEIALVANFDAGGTGPTLLTETGSGNAYITKHLLKETSENTAYSSLVKLSEFFPSATDIRVFEKTGIQYINIIVSMNKKIIHSSEDNIENVNLGTLQQEGDYALAFCRGFGNIENLSSELNTTKDNIFFPISNWVTVIYGQNWGAFFALLATLIYIGIVFYGLKLKKLSISGIFAGAMFFLAGVLGSGGISFIITGLGRLAFKNRIHQLFGFEKFLQGSDYTNVLFIGLVLVSFSVMSFIFCFAIGKKAFIDLFSGVMLVWFIIVLVSAFYFAGLSYMAVWPFVFALFILGWHIFHQGKPGFIMNLVSIFLLIVPAFVLFFPVAYFSSAAGVDKAPLINMMLSLPFGLITPYLHDKLSKQGRVIYASTGILGIILSVAGIIGFAIWVK